MLSNLKIGTKLFVGFFFTIFLLLVVAGTAYLGLSWLGTAVNDLNRYSDVSNLAAEVESTAHSAESLTQKYIRSSREEDYRDIALDIETMRDRLQKIEKTTKRQVMTDWVEEVRPLVDKYEIASKSVHENTDFRARADGERRDTGRGLDKALEAMEDFLQKVIERNDDSLLKAEQHLVWLEKAWRQRERAGRLLRDVLIFTDLNTRNGADKQRVAAMEGIDTEIQNILNDLLAENDGEKEKELANTILKTAKDWGDQGKIFKDMLDDLNKYEDDCYGAIGQIIDIAKKMNESTADAIAGAVTGAGDLHIRVVEVMLIVIAIAVLVAIAVAFALTRMITSGIKEAVSFMQTLAQAGDLSQEIPPHRLAQKDEIGQLAGALKGILDDYLSIEGLAKELADGNWTVSIRSKGERDAMNQSLEAMSTKVNATLREIDDSVKQVATGSNEVSSASQALSNGAQESAASLEEITASMSEISSQTKTNAESAGQARDLAHKASQAATHGQSAMQDMTAAMAQITQNSNEIQRVIKVIDDIAFQTNLLALNAAVEAARAGQHGKGFAVVAEEVRNLAARSAKAAKETSELIAKSGHEIEQGGEVAAKTAEVLNTIVDQIKQTTELVAGIAVASNEQAQGVNQVTIGLQQIDSVTQQNTAAAEESASAANEMSAMAANLQKLVGQFKLR